MGIRDFFRRERRPQGRSAAPAPPDAACSTPDAAAPTPEASSADAFHARHAEPPAGAGPDVSQAIAEFHDATTRDEFLPMFSMVQARRFRMLARTALAEIGYEADMYGDHARTAGGVEIGLWNLASTCAESPTDAAWPILVRSHMNGVRTSVEAAVSAPEGDITQDDLEHRLMVHLVPEGYVSSFGGEADYALEWLTGVRTMLVLDNPGSLTMLTSPLLTTAGPLGPLFDRGLNNLRAYLTSVRLERDTVQQHHGRFTLLRGEDPHVGSLSVLIPEVLQRWLPQANASRGVLFSAPTQSSLLVQPVADAPHLAMTLRLMGAYTVQSHRDEAGSLSPHLFLWRDGTITRLTELGEDGRVGINPGPLLDELGEHS